MSKWSGYRTVDETVSSLAQFLEKHEQTGGHVCTCTMYSSRATCKLQGPYILHTKSTVAAGQCLPLRKACLHVSVLVYSNSLAS